MKKTYSSPDLDVTKFNIKAVLSSSYIPEDDISSGGGKDPFNPEYTQPRN